MFKPISLALVALLTCDPCPPIVIPGTPTSVPGPPVIIPGTPIIVPLPPTDTLPPITLPPLPTTDLAARALASVTEAKVYNEHGELMGSGTAFAVAPELFITNLHVAAAAPSMKLKKGTQHFTVECALAFDTIYDLCLLYVPGANLPVLPVNPAYVPIIGEEVFTAGAPLGVSEIFSSGIISGIVATAIDHAYAFTAPIAPGSSGSPLLNRQGEVIGVCYAGINGALSLQFAIPSQHLAELLNKQRTRTSLDKLPEPTDLMTYLPDFEEFGRYL